MKKFLVLALTILLLLASTSPASAQQGLGREPGIQIHSQAVYLFSLDEQIVVYQRNADIPLYPASLVKIMTAILAIENTPDLRTLVTYPRYVQDYLFEYQRRYSVNVSLAGMRAGEQLPMSSLLHAIMLQSGNEAAMTIADHVGGSQEGFVEMMNARARALGATSTNFTNANGLPDPNMVTTARDMGIITRHAIGLPGFMDIATAVNYTAGPTNLSPRLEWGTTITMQVPGNSLFYPYLRGIKTGTTPQAGRNFISTATRDGFSYLLVVMNAPFLDPETGAQFPVHYAFADTRNIYDWAFDVFRVMPVIERGLRVHEVPLRLSSSQDFLPLEAGDRFSALMARDTDPNDGLTMTFEVPDWVDAPVSRGDHIGYMRVQLYGRDVGRLELLAAETIGASRHLVLLDQAGEIMGSFWFRFGIIFVILLIVAYTALMIARNRNRRRRGGFRPRRRL
ncbi:MAG: D-alanyl-D-alanine carboxypeptidase [Oscillospiraceae bacterium]|nr:D-alanyl-D-alanine carboxypeptidase [Oscillospiraceae bacterium]